VTKTFKAGDHVSWNSEAGRQPALVDVVMDPR
jgi:hypothetical protein